MQISLGRCHYGGDDAATMTGVHPAKTGWIPVCGRHRDRAEQDGYALRVAAAQPGASEDRYQNTAPHGDPDPVEAGEPADVGGGQSPGAGLSLGGCHYGAADVATMTGVRAGHSGWIAVCDRHRRRAETDGYQVRRVISPPVPVPAVQQKQPLVTSAARDEAGDAPGGLDVLEDLLNAPDV